MAPFQTRDPADSALWTERFEQRFLPWVRGGVPAQLAQFVARSVELIYERAFLCARPRRLWPAVAARWAAFLPPGFFYCNDDGKGPPFGLAAGELDVLLASRFEWQEDRPVDDSAAVFAGKERWQVWRRLG